MKKSKSAIPSCSRYLARVIYKLRLNSWNTKYSQNVTCVCKNILPVKHILLECPITTELFQKNGYDLNAYNNVRDIHASRGLGDVYKRQQTKQQNILSVKHILLECPYTTELFQKHGYDLNAYNNVRDILYHSNTDVITNIVKSIVHSPVGKLV